MKSELDAIFPRVRASVFKLLWMGPERGYHLRELARRSGLAIGTIQQEVANLSSIELIVPNRDGNRLYYSANREHPIYKDIKGLVLKTGGIIDHIKRSLEGVKGIQLAWIFGSVASDDFSSESDVDMFVMGSTGMRGLAPIIREASDQLSREINSIVMPENEYLERLLNGEAFVQAVSKSQKVWLIGSEDELKGLASQRVVASSQDKCSPDS